MVRISKLLRCCFALENPIGILANIKCNAIALYKKAVETNPEFAEGFFYLAKALLDEGKALGESETNARKGLALEPDGQTSPLGHFVIGGVLMQRGQAAEAQRELNKGLALEARLGKRAR